MADLLTFALIATHTNTEETETYLVKNFSIRSAITTTPDELLPQLLECETTPGSVIDATHFASVNYVIIRNIDSANFVTVEWDNAAATTQTQVIAAGKFIVLSDVDPSASLTVVADTAACLCEILIDGS